jgi:hypothetical protein
MKVGTGAISSHQRGISFAFPFCKVQIRAAQEWLTEPRRYECLGKNKEFLQAFLIDTTEKSATSCTHVSKFIDIRRVQFHCEYT